jgi:hypothetical protein
MRNRRLVLAGVSLLSALPISRLYAECTYTPTMGGGEIRECDNGTCKSRSTWQDNRLVSVDWVECKGDIPQT